MLKISKDSNRKLMTKFFFITGFMCGLLTAILFNQIFGDNLTFRQNSPPPVRENWVQNAQTTWQPTSSSSEMADCIEATPKSSSTPNLISAVDGTQTTPKLTNNSLPSSNSTAPKYQRILCWVVTKPGNKVKAEAVNSTWGRKCDKLLFVSSKPDNGTNLPIVALPLGEESRTQLWNKAKLTLRHVYMNHLNDFDWFFKADDDTYVIMENLRTLLVAYNSSEPYFVGHEFRAAMSRFLSGGAGYVLSRESLRRLVEKGLDQNLCPTNFKGEEDDVTITECLYKVGAFVPNTSDERGHHRFLSCNVEQFYNAKVGPVDCRPRSKTLNCLSDLPITFHYVSGNQMLMYEYLIHQVKINATQFVD